MINYNKEARVKELEKLIRHHRILYYNDMPQIADQVFDALVDELADLDCNSEVLFEVGAPAPRDSHWIKRRHSIPMGSQDKVNDVKSFREWAIKRGAELEYIAQDKMDGLSISLDYVDGKLIAATTRGDGEVGEDITRNIVLAKGVRKSLPDGITCSLRGEVMLTEHDYKEYQREAKKQAWRVLNNPRNGASGLARRLSGEGCEFLKVYFYDVVGDISFLKESDKIEWLSSLGMFVPTVFVGSIDTIESFFKSYSEARDSLSYEIDGVVVKINSIKDAEAVENRLRSDTHTERNPKSQVAWKFEDEARVTVLESIEWQVGKSGRITPVGILRPVEIGGVTVRRASLHNWSNIKSLDLALNDQVLVKRANEVIPQIVESLRTSQIVEDKNAIRPVKRCPECKESTSWDGEYLVCTNTACKSRLVGNIRKWIEYLEIQYFGEKLIEALVDAELIYDVADLYSLSEEDLTSLDGVASRGAKRALRNLYSRKTIPLYLFFGSLNIPGFGRSLAKYIVDSGFDTFDKFRNITRKELSSIDKFGPERAELIVRELQSDRIRDLTNRLLVSIEIENQTSSSSAHDSKTFCVTGKLSMTKKEIQKRVEESGHIWKKSVSKDLDYLICANPNSGSSKLKKAKKHGVEIITEKDFLTIIDE